MSAPAGAAGARRGRGAAHGALLGTLAGLLLVALGAADALGVGEDQLVPLAGAVLGGALGWAGRAGWLVPGGIGLAILYFAAALLPWTGLVERWVRADPLPPAPVDAIVVLSSGLSRDSLLLSGGSDRLLAGLALWQAGVAPRLVTTRVVRREDGARVTSDADQRRLVALAGAQAAWLVVDSIGVTRDEAVRAAELLTPLGVREIVLVTSPAHTRRACAAFEQVGFRVHCHAALERERRTWRARTGRDRLSTLRALLYELLGAAKYRTMGWI